MGKRDTTTLADARMRVFRGRAIDQAMVKHSLRHTQRTQKDVPDNASPLRLASVLCVCVALFY